MTSKYSNVELQNLPVAYKLDGKNYLKWSQVVKTFLKGKGRLNHLLKASQNPGDSKFDAWDEEEYDYLMAVEFNVTRNQQQLHVFAYCK